MTFLYVSRVFIRGVAAYWARVVATAPEWDVYQLKAPRKPRQYFTGHPTAPSTLTILYGGHYSINDQLGRHLKWAVEQGESGLEFPPRVTLKVKTHINFIVEIDTSQDAWARRGPKLAENMMVLIITWHWSHWEEGILQYICPCPLPSVPPTATPNANNW